MELYASILGLSPEEIGPFLERFRPYIEGVHLDIDAAVSPEMMEAVRCRVKACVGGMPIWYHLMTPRWREWLSWCAQVTEDGRPPVATVPWEFVALEWHMQGNSADVLERYEGCFSCHLSIALNPATLDVSSPVAFLPACREWVVVGVHPGASGRSFLSDTPTRFAQVQEAVARTQSRAQCSLDGGITPETLRLFTIPPFRCAVGSFFHRACDAETAVRLLREAVLKKTL